MKRFLYFVIAVILVCNASAVPALADDGYIDFTKAGGWLTTNRKVTASGSETDLDKLVDGDAASSFLGPSPTSGNMASDGYVQVNLPAPVSLKQIRVAISGTQIWWAIKEINVSVSNDPTFASKTEIWRTTDYVNSDESPDLPAYSVKKKDGEVNLDAEDISAAVGDASYRYLRVSQNGVSTYFALSEITVLGEYAEEPGNGVNLTQYPDIDASASGTLGNSVTNNLFNGDSTNAVSIAPDNNRAWLRIDLQRPSTIHSVELDKEANSNKFFLFLSNNDTVGDDILSSAAIDTAAVGKKHRIIYSYNGGACNTHAAIDGSGETYRYVYILATEKGKPLSFTDAKVYGEFTRNVDDMVNLAKLDGTEITADSNQEYLSALTDGDLSNEWCPSSPGQSVVFMLDKIYNVGKIGILPAAWDDGSPVNIEFSNSLDFPEDDTFLAYSSSQNEFPVYKMSFIVINADKSYQYIRITKPQGMNALREVRIITDDIKNLFNISDHYPVSGATGITNTYSEGVFDSINGAEDVYNGNDYVTITFSKPINKATVSSDTIVFTGNKEKVQYTESDYSVDGKIFSLNLKKLSSFTDYTVEVTNGLESADGDSLSYSLNFSTGVILKEMPLGNGRMANLAKGKNIPIRSGVYAEYPLVNGTDDKLDTACLAANPPSNGEYTYLVVDLMNVYDIYAVELRQRAGCGHDLRNADIIASKTLCGYEDMEVIGKVGDAGCVNDLQIIYLGDYMREYRYIGVRRTGLSVPVGFAELRVWGFAEENYSPWNTVLKKKQVTTISESGTYTASCEFSNMKTDADTLHYGVFIARYDKDGMFLGFANENKTVLVPEGQTVPYSTDIEVDENTAMLEFMILEDPDDPSSCTDSYQLVRE